MSKLEQQLHFCHTLFSWFPASEATRFGSKWWTQLCHRHFPVLWIIQASLLISLVMTEVNMAIALPTTLTIFFGIVALYVISRLLRGQGNGRPLPPGPKGIPILGNINDMPKPGTLECHHWLQHKELYGAYNPYLV